MNRFKCHSLLYLLLVLSIVSCGPTATFDDPQPFGIKEEYRFDKNYLGKYLSTDSSHSLFIRPNLVTTERNSYTDILINNLDTSYKLSGDTLFYKPDKSWRKVLVTDSSIIQHDIIIDTIFRFVDGNVLKKYKGQYFLNHQDSDTKKWNVTKLSQSNDNLTLSYIYGKDDIELLNEITNSNIDTTLRQVNYNLDKKQFKKFLKSDGFRNIETYIRIKN